MESFIEGIILILLFSPTSASMNLIKKPVIKRLIESEDKLRSFRIQTMRLTRYIVEANNEFHELSSIKTTCAIEHVINNNDKKSFTCEEGFGKIVWGGSLWSENYAPVDIIVGVALLMFVVGVIIGLILSYRSALISNHEESIKAEKTLKLAREELMKPDPKASVYSRNTDVTLQPIHLPAHPPIPYNEPITDGGLRSNNGISVPSFVSTSSNQLLRTSELHLTEKAEYREFMQSISAVSSITPLLESSDSVKSEVAVALTSTELSEPRDAHLGEDSDDLFGGMHPPPVPIRDKEELIAFASHLLEETLDKIAPEATSPAALLPLHLVSVSSLLVGSGRGDLPSMFAVGESTLSTADRLRCLAESYLLSEQTCPHLISPLRRSTMITLAETALSEYERALASSKAICRAHVAYPQGVCLFILARFSESLRAFNEALIGPHKARAWHAKGKLLASQGDLPASEHCLLKALEIANEDDDEELRKALEADVDTVYDHLPHEERRKSNTKKDLTTSSMAFIGSQSKLVRSDSECSALSRHSSLRSLEDRDDEPVTASEQQAIDAINKIAAKEFTDKIPTVVPPKRSKWGVLRTAVKVKAALNSKRPSVILTRKSSITDDKEIKLDIGQAVKEWQRRRSTKFYHVEEPEDEEEQHDIISNIAGLLRRKSSLKSPRSADSEPSSDAEGWERKVYRAGQGDSDSAATAARAGQRQGSITSDPDGKFRTPARRAHVEVGDHYLPPFTLEICSASVISAMIRQNGRRSSFADLDEESTYKVIATVVDEVQGVRPLQDQQVIEAAKVVSPTLSPDAVASLNKGPTALDTMTNETLTHLDHAYQTNTSCVEPESEKVSVVEITDNLFDDIEDEDDEHHQTTNTALKWGEGGLLTICGARADSLVVLTLMKQANSRHDENPNMIVRKGICLGQVGVPLLGLVSALKMVQGRILLTCKATLEKPSIWLRHEGPSSTQKDDWGIGGGLLSPTSAAQSPRFEDKHISSCSIKFKIHGNGRLDTLEASRRCGVSRDKEPSKNMLPSVPCAIALLNPAEERDVLYGEGIEEPYLVALTADRILCFVYDELSEPRCFKAVTSPLTTTVTSQLEETTQCQDPFSLSMFSSTGGPKSLFALRHNREFPLRRLTSIREVGGAGCEDPRLELIFRLHVLDAAYHDHGHSDSAGLGVEAKVLLGGRRASLSRHGHYKEVFDHGEEFTKVTVVLRFKKDKKHQIHAWAAALKQAVNQLPGSIFAMEHALANGGDPDRPVLVPISHDSLANTPSVVTASMKKTASAQHLLFSPLRVTRHIVGGVLDTPSLPSKS